MCAKKPINKVPCNSRLSLSEIEQPFYCSIVGTCLTLDELRAMAQKLELPEAESDYDLHVAFIELTNSNSKVCRMVTKKLDRKFRQTIRRFNSARSEQDLVDLWKDARNEGKIPGAYWAILTHPEASALVIGQVFGDVHMLSHLSGASRRVDIREHRRLESENEQLRAHINSLRKQLDASQKRGREKQDELIQVRAHVEQLGETCACLRSENEELSKREAGVLQQKMEAAIKQRDRADAQRRRAERDRLLAEQKLLEREKQQEQFEKDRSAFEDEIRVLEHELRRALDAHHPTRFGSNPRSCLHGRSVLYVGGRANLVARYRELVERRGGTFIHHDGTKDNDRLPERVSRADIVCCPVDCVSHNACLRVKHCCRSQSKGCAFLRSSGLSSLVVHLDAVENNASFD